MIDVVLPALNEGLALPGVLAAMPSGYHVIVADNGSTDDTAAVAEAHGAQVVTEPVPGYGAAVHAGLLVATADIVCVLDADGSLDPGELPDLVELVASGSADLVVGRRRPAGRGAWPWHARLANRVLAARLSRRLGVSLHDLGPVRVFRRQPMIELGIQDRRFGYPIETMVRAAAAGWRIFERDVTYGPRTAGTKSKVTGSVSGSVKAIRDFSRVMP